VLALSAGCGGCSAAKVGWPITAALAAPSSEALSNSRRPILLFIAGTPFSLETPRMFLSFFLVLGGAFVFTGAWSGQHGAASPCGYR
jgi:hypothetical protein